MRPCSGLLLQLATYTYDAAGQRTSSVVGQGSVTTTSTYTYEGLTLLSLDAESTEGTAAASWRIDYLADASGRPYGGIYTSGETSAVAFGIVTTDRGDVRELTDGEGIPFARYDHDAYGNPTRTLSAATPELDAATAEAIAGRNILRYAGYAFDEHSGLYYLSQRYYDPATCQFITKDPAKADGEESAYQYCGGDPGGKIDPSGEAYSATAAVNYARRWRVGWDPRWYWNKGKECTQWLSAALYAGGFRESFYSCHGQPLHWWATSRQASTAWSSASDAFSYLTQRRGLAFRRYRKRDIPLSQNRKAGYIAWARTGDAIFYKYNGATRINHAALVVATGRYGGTLRGQHNATWAYDIRGTKDVKPDDFIYVVRPR